MSNVDVDDIEDLEEVEDVEADETDLDDVTEDPGAGDDGDDEAVEAGETPGWQPPEGRVIDAIEVAEQDAGLDIDSGPSEADEGGDVTPGWQRPDDRADEAGETDNDDDSDVQDSAADDETDDDVPEEDPIFDGPVTLDLILDKHLVTMMYQPIVSLLDDSVVGYEALARGPEGSDLATPADMFGAAAEQGKLKELDLLCQAQAVVQAKDVLLKSGHALFVNIDPTVLLDAALGRDPDAAEQVSSLLTNVTAACPVVLEISASHDYSSLAELLAVTVWARGNGFRVALDDVDVNCTALAMLPLIEPDVIKLARGVLSASPDADLGLLLRAVRTQSERTGAAVVCQGVESDTDHDLALSLGATHAEGFGIGLPQELSEAPIRIRSLEPVSASWGEPCSTPFELIANSSQLRTGSGDLLLALTLDLERQATTFSNACILSSFERTTSAPSDVGSRYQKIAKSADFAVLLGDARGKRKGIFHGEVEAGDPLCSERAIVVLTPQFSAALLARVAGGGESDRQYAFALVYDRGQVTRAARMLMSYIDLDHG